MNPRILETADQEVIERAAKTLVAALIVTNAQSMQIDFEDFRHHTTNHGDFTIIARRRRKSWFRRIFKK